MLRECDQITSKMTWRKAISYLELDPRFNLVAEREKEELFDQFLQEKERQQRVSGENPPQAFTTRLTYICLFEGCCKAGAKRKHASIQRKTSSRSRDQYQLSMEEGKVTDCQRKAESIL
jgi:hypothetical protein